MKASSINLHLVLLMTIAAGAALAAPPPKAAHEIEQLIAVLGRSGCDFQRNGSWHPPAKAEAHLRRKYEWLRQRDLVDSAEQFIDRAGSKSSLSGHAYQVRCPGKPAVASSTWLHARLAEIRKRTPAPH